MGGFGEGVGWVVVVVCRRYMGMVLEGQVLIIRDGIDAVVVGLGLHECGKPVAL